MTFRFDPAIEAVLRDAFAWKGYGTRLRKTLRQNEVTTLGDLLALSEVELMRTPGMGRETVNRLIAALAANGLALSSGNSGGTLADRIIQIEARIAMLEEKILK